MYDSDFEVGRYLSTDADERYRLVTLDSNDNAVRDEHRRNMRQNVCIFLLTSTPDQLRAELDLSLACSD